MPMTLNQIISKALAQIERGHDAQLIEKYKDAFTQYANEAQLDIADSFKLTHSEIINITENSFDVSDLEKTCTKIISVKQNNRPVCFDDGDETGEILVGRNGPIEIKYRYIPKNITSDTETPDVPDQFHQLIVTYVVARYRASGDPDTQSGSSIFFNLYENAKRQLMRHYGAPSNYKLLNIF